MKEGSRKLILGVIVGIIIIGVVYFSIKITKPKGPVCNAPYIQVGTVCCLDQDSNMICDKDEEQKDWEFSDFKVYGTTAQEYGDGMEINFEYLSKTKLSPTTIQLSLKQKDLNTGTLRQCKYYSGAYLILVTEIPVEFYNNNEPEKVFCEVEEYYNNKFNEKVTTEFDRTERLEGEDYSIFSPDLKYGYGKFIHPEYEVENKPSQVKYIISCEGGQSHNKASKTFIFNIEYLDEMTVSQFWC